jgi:hypothetical protein
MSRKGEPEESWQICSHKNVTGPETRLREKSGGHGGPPHHSQGFSSQSGLVSLCQHAALNGMSLTNKVFSYLTSKVKLP